MAPSKKKQKIFVRVSEDEFRDLGGEIMVKDPEGRSQIVFERKWNSFFGVGVKVCVDVWDRLEVNPNDDAELTGAKPCHLLWALMFLKMYGAEEEMSTLAGAGDEKVFRKWSKIFVVRISFLIFDVVSAACGDYLFLMPHCVSV